jgi:hypothetical protein
MEESSETCAPQATSAGIRRVRERVAKFRHIETFLHMSGHHRLMLLIQGAERRISREKTEISPAYFP